MGGIEKALCSWAILNPLPAVKSKRCTLRAVMRRATLNGPRTNTYRPPTQATLRCSCSQRAATPLDARVEVEIAFARGHDAQLAGAWCWRLRTAARARRGSNAAACHSDHGGRDRSAIENSACCPMPQSHLNWPSIIVVSCPLFSSTLHPFSFYFALSRLSIVAFAC